MKGLVLAAGRAQRLRPLTDALPKALLPLDDEHTLLDVTLANLRAVGIEDVVIVTGFAGERIEERVPALERRHRVRLELVRNDRHEWNNAYSLWLARATFAAGALLVNGDTLHPVSVERVLTRALAPEVVLALDEHKALGAEEMKVLIEPPGRVVRIHKELDPAAAHGEYIGLAVIRPDAAEPLAAALEATWKRDPHLYYEDGFQTFRDAGGGLGAVPIGTAPWIEVDDHDDLARARALFAPPRP